MSHTCISVATRDYTPIQTEDSDLDVKSLAIALDTLQSSLPSEEEQEVLVPSINSNVTARKERVEGGGSWEKVESWWVMAMEMGRRYR